MVLPKKSQKNRKVLEESGKEKLKGEYIFLIILIAIGAALRFYHLDFNSLWLDEISTYNYSSSNFIGMWQIMLTGTDYNPPLFFILERVILVGFGISEFTLRVLPALFGTLTIFTIYLIGKEFRGAYTGLIAAGIFTFSPFLIFYSQEARPYALVLLLCTVLMWTLLRALKSNLTKDWIYFSVIAAALIWVHFYATVFVIILGIFAVIKNRNTIRPLLISIIVGAVLILPIAIVFIPLFLQRTSTIPSFGMQGLPLVYGMIIQLSGFSVQQGYSVC
jgi:mannosyltransferase